ncbi:hypothetical protein EX30DRAFT_326118 [Ascodesmis nigricans]|uniref:Uncharacterized protein n=1 Tax=Ascodesmis nigricans TaxID=341454 RepID=A0A4S2N720_9PEZI|nr:hypothetical protein EX30DRAFT_326118 [Ascodesmis nigricans]
MSLPEEDLIKSRPLLFESRPFTRIPKRILLPPATTHTLIDTDFLPLLTSLPRHQLLLQTSVAEIARYSASVENIHALTATARETLTSLHSELAEAEAEKKNRLEYDAIVESFITTTKERGETEGAIRRLVEECEELEREARGYEEVWVGRKRTFEGIVGQLEGMWKQIKEEKEEHERREGMSEGEEEEVEEGEEEEEVEEGGKRRGKEEEKIEIREEDRMDTS